MMRSRRVEVLGRVTDPLSIPIPIGKGASARTVSIEVPSTDLLPVENHPGLFQVREMAAFWIFNGVIARVEGSGPLDETIAAVKLAVLRHEKQRAKELRELELLERDATHPATPSRERIAESIRHAVWRRDGGHCVLCASTERLEFDHIIPVSEGGSSTERNIQLLCETCNRSKGASI